MERFVQRGVRAGRGAGAAGGVKRGGGRQSTIESCAKVVTMNHSSLSFTATDLLRLKGELERQDVPAAALLDTLRMLSSLVISTADLQATMIGRAVNKLKQNENADVARVASNLVAKWKAEVERFKAKQPEQLAPKQLPKARTLQPGTLEEELGARHRGSGGVEASSAAQARQSLQQPAGADGAVGALPRAQRSAAVQALADDIVANPSLRTALLSDWAAPAGALPRGVR